MSIVINGKTWKYRYRIVYGSGRTARNFIYTNSPLVLNGSMVQFQESTGDLSWYHTYSGGGSGNGGRWNGDALYDLTNLLHPIVINNVKYKYLSILKSGSEFLEAFSTSPLQGSSSSFTSTDGELICMYIDKIYGPQSSCVGWSAFDMNIPVKAGVDLITHYDYPNVNITIDGLSDIEGCTKFAIFRSSESTNVVDTGEKIFESTDLTDVEYNDNVSYGETYYYQLICYDANMDIIVESEIQEQVAKVHYKFTNGGLIGSNKLTQTLIDELYLNTTLQDLVTSHDEQQLVTLPYGKYTVKLNGAKGSDGGSNPSGTVPGGKGYSITVDDFIVNGPLYITVGNPGDQLNGTNSASTTKDVTVGGGGATGSMTDSSGPRCCGSGGGASYISTDGTLEGRILIAAGGGSAGWSNFKGGDGGLEVGKSGDGGTTGGTQSSGGTNSRYSSANGTFGIGGKGQGNSGGGGGGGGGYYGGAGGYGGYNAGSGGSSYVGEYNVVKHGVTTDEPCVIFYIDEEPDPTKSPGVRNLKATYSIETKQVTLTWENPSEFDTFAGFRVLRKLNSSSKDINDGDVVFESNNSSSQTFTETLPYNQIFYYTIFTHNADLEYGNQRSIMVDTRPTSVSFPKRFNQGAAVKNIGPTQQQLNDTYAGTTLEGEVISHEGIQEWIVPHDGVYKLTAKGAAGGDQPESTKPGRGAIISGTVNLKRGDRLFIVVGQMGYSTGTSDTDAGGGGGSFIVIEDPSSSDILKVGTLNVPVTPLIIAGGGSGEPEDGEGTDASLTEGSSGNTPNPNIGEGATIGKGAGGGGFRSSGRDYNTNAYGGKGFLQGAKGGTGTYGIGGFGGGAGGYDNAGAGGGGYTGGVAYDGTNNNGGGGSFVNECVTDVSKSINPNRETGEVTIQALDIKLLTYVGLDNDGIIYDYDYESNVWIATDEVFSILGFKYGTSEISYDVVKQLPEGVNLICATDSVNESIVYETIGIPATNIIKQINDFNTDGIVIIGSEVMATDEVQIVVSINQGETWMYFNGTNWVEYQNDYIGMSISDYNSLTKNMWNLLNYKTTNSVRVGFIINANEYTPTDKINSFEFRTIQC